MGSIGAINSQRANEMVLRSGKPDMRQTNAVSTRSGTINFDQTKIEAIAQAVDDQLKTSRHDLKIRVDKKTGKAIVKVVSKEDGKTIRQIPSDDLLRLASKMEEMRGVMFDEKS